MRAGQRGLFSAWAFSAWAVQCVHVSVRAVSRVLATRARATQCEMVGTLPVSLPAERGLILMT